MFPRELLKRVRQIEIATDRAVESALAGGYQSVFRGHGMAFEEVRAYAPGDDIRAIDWNVTARTGLPFIKLFREERELTVWLLVDASASTRFASTGRLKSETAAELAALAAFSAIKNNDRVGLIQFTDRVERFIPPKKGKKHVLRVIADVLTFKPEHHGTGIATALEFINRVTRRQAVVFLISDFFGADYEQPLRIAAKRHDVIPLVLTDPLDTALPDVGLALIEDPETGERFYLDTASAAVRAAFQRTAETAHGDRMTTFKRLSLDTATMAAGRDHVAPLIELFRRRARRG